VKRIGEDRFNVKDLRELEVASEHELQVFINLAVAYAVAKRKLDGGVVTGRLRREEKELVFQAEVAVPKLNIKMKSNDDKAQTTPIRGQLSPKTNKKPAVKPETNQSDKASSKMSSKISSQINDKRSAVAAKKSSTVSPVKKLI